MIANPSRQTRIESDVVDLNYRVGMFKADRYLLDAMQIVEFVKDTASVESDGEGGCLYWLGVICLVRQAYTCGELRS